MRKTLFILIVQLFISKINAQSYMGYMGKCNLVNQKLKVSMKKLSILLTLLEVV